MQDKDVDNERQRSEYKDVISRPISEITNALVVRAGNKGQVTRSGSQRFEVR